MIGSHAVRHLQHAAIGSLLLASLCVSALSVTTAREAPQPSSWSAVEVTENATLWGLAAAHPIDGLSTQATVERIQAKNELTTATLYPGQTVLVPGADDAGLALASL